MLLHQGTGGGQEQHLSALLLQHLGDDHGRHHGLPESGGQHQQRGGPCGPPGQLHLVVALLHALRLYQGVLIIHDW